MKKIWHPYHKWECYKNGFYSSFQEIGITKEQAQIEYFNFLKDLSLFENVLKSVITEWKHSCEHFLTDKNSFFSWLSKDLISGFSGDFMPVFSSKFSNLWEILSSLSSSCLRNS